MKILDEPNAALGRMRSAGLLIEVLPHGDGKVKIAISNVGPLKLGEREAVDLLTKATLQIARENGDDDERE